MIIRKIGGLAAMCAAAAALAAPAIAADRDGLDREVRVNRAAVTPSSPVEARRSLARLSSAAMQACGLSSFDLPPIQDAIRHSSCWDASMRDVVARIDNQYLNAAFARRGTVEVADSRGGSATHAR